MQSSQNPLLYAISPQKKIGSTQSRDSVTTSLSNYPISNQVIGLISPYQQNNPKQQQQQQFYQNQQQQLQKQYQQQQQQQQQYQYQQQQQSQSQQLPQQQNQFLKDLSTIIGLQFKGDQSNSQQDILNRIIKIKEERDKLKKELPVLEAKIGNKSFKILKKNEELQYLQTKVNELETYSQKLDTSAISEQQGRLEQKNKILEINLNNLMEENLGLTKELQKRSQQILKAQDNQRAAQVQALQLKKELDSLRNQQPNNTLINEQRILIDQLKQQLQQANQKLVEIEQTHKSEKDALYQNLQKIQSDFNQISSKYQQVLKQQQEQKEYYEKQINDIEKKHDELKDKLREEEKKRQDIMISYEKQQKQQNYANQGKSGQNGTDSTLICQNKVAELEQTIHNNKLTYQINIQNVAKELEETEQNYEILQQDYNKIFEENKKLKQQQQEQLANEINDPKSNIDKFKKKLQLANNQISELQQENYILNNQYIQLQEDLIKFKEQDLEQNSKNTIQVNELTQKVKELKDLLKQREYELNDVRSKGIVSRVQDETPKNELISRFDVIIKCGLFKELHAPGWLLNVKDKDEYNLIRTKEAVVVSVLGQSKIGKSYIGNKIFGKKFAVPEIYQNDLAIGVSYGVMGNGVLVLLETCNFDHPIGWSKKEEVYNTEQVIQEEDDDEEEDSKSNQQQNQNQQQDPMEGEFDENMRDRYLSENLLQDFAVSSSDVLLIVVNNLTYSNQKLIAKYRKRLKDKFIFVVHNWKNVGSIEQINHRIKQFIIKPFNVESKKVIANADNTKNAIIFCEKNLNDNIFHLIVGKENTEAGSFYNETAIDYLISLLWTIKSQKNFDVLEQFKKYLFENIEFYSESQKESIVQAPVEKDPNSLKIFSLQPQFLKKIIIDELGELQLESSGQKLKYTLTVNNDSLILRIDTPGFVLTNDHLSLELDNENQYIIVENDRVFDIDRVNENLLANTREFGKFKMLSIGIPLNRFIINTQEEPLVTTLDGVAYIRVSYTIPEAEQQNPVKI